MIPFGFKETLSLEEEKKEEPIIKLSGSFKPVTQNKEVVFDASNNIIVL